MLWLGILGRRKLAGLDERQERLESAFRMLQLEMTDALDKMDGIARRFTGRKGGRPPSQPSEPEVPPELQHLDPISREIILQRRRGPYGRNGEE